MDNYFQLLEEEFWEENFICPYYWNDYRIECIYWDEILLESFLESELVDNLLQYEEYEIYLNGESEILAYLVSLEF